MLKDIQKIAETEFSDIVKETFITNYKLRILLKDGSFLGVNLSEKHTNKFGFHWETLRKEMSMFRYDTFPDPQWVDVLTFPYHFHNGHQNKVIASPFPTNIYNGFRAFMEFVKKNNIKR